MDYEKTGRFIQQLRKEKGMTQLTLAERLGVTDRAVSRWERGKGFPDVSMLKPLAEALGISVSELLDGERRAPDKAVRFSDGSEAVSVAEADAAAVNGIHAYVRDTKRKTRIWKYGFLAVLVMLVALLPLTIGHVRDAMHAPVNFQEDDLDFDGIRVINEDGTMEEVDLEGSLGEEFRSQVEALLRQEITMEWVKFRGYMLPRDEQEGIAVELEGLATFYRGAYYDHKSEKYYTSSYYESIYRYLSSMCVDKLRDKDYAYEGEYAFSCDGQTLTLACTPTEQPMELIVDMFNPLLKDEPYSNDAHLYDKWVEDYRIEKIRRLLPEEYSEIIEFQYFMEKEIPYRDLYDYRIYLVTYEFTRIPEAAPMGFQYPDNEPYDMLVMTAKSACNDEEYHILPEYITAPLARMP